MTALHWARRVFLFPLVAVAVLVSQREATAGFALLVDGTDVADGVTAANGSSMIFFSGTVDGYAIDVWSRLTLAPGQAGANIKTFVDVTATNGSLPPVTIQLVGTDLPPLPVSPVDSTLTDTTTRNLFGFPPTSGTATFSASAVGSGGGGGSTNPFTLPPLQSSGSGGGAAATFGAPVGPYTLTQSMTLSGLQNGDSGMFTENTTILPAPAPAAALGLVGGLPVLALFRRRFGVK